MEEVCFDLVTLEVENSAEHLPFFFLVASNPWKINMEHINHPFRKENYLPNLHDYVPC